MNFAYAVLSSKWFKKKTLLYLQFTLSVLMYLYNVGFDMIFGEEGLYVRTAYTNILNMK